MDEVDAEGLGDRDKERGEDVQRARGVQEAAGYEQQDVDDDEEDYRAAAGEVGQRAGDGEVQAAAGEDVGEHAGRRGDEEDGGGGAGRVDDDGLELLEPDGLVDEDAYHEAIHDAHGRGLGRGEDAAVDAAEDDDGHQEAPEGLLEGDPAVMPAGLGQLDEVGLAAEDKGRGDEARAHDEAGDDARLEEVADADAGGNRAVDDEGDAGRDDDADSAGAGHEGRGETGAVPGADHAGNHDEAEGRDGGRAGAGDGGEEAGDDDADNREAAAQVADAGFGEVDEALGYLRLVHDVAGEDEVGDGQQHEFAHRGAEHLRHGAHDGVQRAARALDEHGGDARDAEADGYRRAHYEKQGEAYEQYGGYHFSMASFPSADSGLTFASSIVAWAKRIVMKNAPKGTKVA